MRASGVLMSITTFQCITSNHSLIIPGFRNLRMSRKMSESSFKLFQSHFHLIFRELNADGFAE